MAKAKAKMPALDVPQDDSEADALLKTYGQDFNALSRLGATMNDQLADLKAQFEADAAPIKERMIVMEAQLTAYAAAHRKRLTDDGKTKTITLPAGVLGWRNKPPSVRFAKGLKAEDIVSNIRAKIAGWRATRRVAETACADMAEHFIRTKEEPNKEAMLEEAQVATEIEGVRIGSAGEEFYMAPFGAELAESKQ